MYQSKSLGSKLPRDLSAHRFACPSPETVHWYEVHPKMTSCTFLKVLLRAIFSCQLTAQASSGSRGQGVIQSHLGRKGASPRFQKVILHPPLCTRQMQRSWQGTLCPGRAGRQGTALPSPASSARPPPRQPSFRDGAGCSSPAMPPAPPCSTRVLPDYWVKDGGCPAGLYLLSPALAT